MIEIKRTCVTKHHEFEWHGHSCCLALYCEGDGIGPWEVDAYVNFGECGPCVSASSFNDGWDTQVAQALLIEEDNNTINLELTIDDEFEALIEKRLKSLEKEANKENV